VLRSASIRAQVERWRRWAVLGLFALLAPTALPWPVLAEEFLGKVVQVVDADTLIVAYGRRRLTVRLQGIDAPEVGQAFAGQAKEFAASLILGLLVNVRQSGVDRSGRILADVLLPDGRSVNRELVRSGFAWWYRRSSTDRSLGQLEAEARSARRGLWLDRYPVPPWDWRTWTEEQQAMWQPVADALADGGQSAPLPPALGE
jgi:endonuclease YncB( thermonuclease family)